MAEKRSKLIFAVAITATVVCLHAVLDAFFRGTSGAISYVFYGVVSLAAIAVCLRRSMTSGTRRNWLLTAFAFLLWFIANILAARQELFLQTSVSATAIDDFFYFFFGVPLLLVIASPDERESIPFFFWLDGLQVAAAGFLTYVAVFSILPFSSAPAHPIQVDRLILLFNIEVLLLAVCSSARLLSCVPGTCERQYFKVLTVYLWAAVVCRYIYNSTVAKYGDAGFLDPMPEIPFLVFMAATAVIAPPQREESLTPHRRSSLALTVEHARPFLLGLALVALCAIVVREHLRFAICIIFGSFCIYGLRSAILQSRFSRAQVALEDARDRLEQLALLDGLTGIANRRCFDQRLALEWSRSHRAQTSLSLLLIDIDHFKKLNDTFGHLTGDECLIQVAATLRKVLNRPGDLLARYGGEEFVALLPETEAAGAANVARRMQAALAETPPAAAIGNQVTISVGGTTWTDLTSATVEQFVEAADRAMYQAKQNGRNRVEFIPLEGLSAG